MAHASTTLLSRWAQPDSIIPQTQGTQAWDRYAYVNNSPLNYADPTGHFLESLLYIASIAYDLYDIAQNGLNWGSGLSLAADVASLALPVVTGGGLAVRAAMHADDVVDVVRAANAATNVAQTANQIDNTVDASLIASESSSTLFHYTNEKGLNGILESNELLPSLKSVNPKDVRYGEGQYLTDIVPGSMTPNQLSRQLVGNPFLGSKYTHYVEIDVQGLNVIQGRPNVYVVPNTKPLDITNRLVNNGAVTVK